jgi:hypothetical protein
MCYIAGVEVLNSKVVGLVLALNENLSGSVSLFMGSWSPER